MFGILNNKRVQPSGVHRIWGPSSNPLGGICFFFFHSLGWLAIPHRIVRGMRVQRMPIKGILLEGQGIISSGGWAQESAHSVVG